jgi:hypothetical protein
MGAGLYGLATIASIAPWVGMFGTIVGMTNSFPGYDGPRVSIRPIIFELLSESLWPTAFGLFVGLMALWFYKYLAARLGTFDLEMDNATLELLNTLSRFRGTVIHRPSDSRMFAEMPLEELRRDEKFWRRCMFLAGTALVLAFCVQVLRSAASAPWIYTPITFGISCIPAYPLWVKLLRRRRGGLVALGSLLCLCWSVAELLLGTHLP